MENGKKIAFLLPRYAGGGAERVSLALARSLRDFGYDTELWATRFDAQRRAEVKAEGFATASPRDAAGRVRHRSRAATEAIARMVQERGIDILVISVSPLGYMQELRKRIGSRCRIVFHLHGQPFWELAEFADAELQKWSVRRLKEKLFHTYTRRATRLYRETYAACDAYVVLCDAYKNELEQRLGIDRQFSKARAIYNPIVDLKKLAALRGIDRRREVVFVGRLTYADKRVDRLLRVWQRVGRPDWTLRIVGDGPCAASLEKLADSLGLANVSFEGYADPKPYYAQAYIVAMTSTFEGWPGSLVEGLAAGCRAIAFGCSGGVEEILSDGRGVAVPPFNEEEYARRLARMMDEYPSRPRQTETAAWTDSLTDENTAQTWHELFCSLQGVL